jgi:hypothetical protein
MYSVASGATPTYLQPVNTTPLLDMVMWDANIPTDTTTEKAIRKVAGAKLVKVSKYLFSKWCDSHPHPLSYPTAILAANVPNPL